MLHEAGFSLFWFVLGCKIGQICKRQKRGWNVLSDSKRGLPILIFFAFVQGS